MLGLGVPMAKSATRARSLFSRDRRPPRAYESLSSLPQFPLLHTLVTIILCYHLLFSRETAFTPEEAHVTVAVLLGLAVLLWRLPAPLLGTNWFVATWVLGVTAVTVTIIHLSGHRGSDLYIIFFLLILLAAFAPSIKQIIALSLILCLGYGLLLYSAVEGIGSLSESHFLRFPLLLILGTFYGHSLDLLRRERQEMWALRQRHQATEAAYQESVERLDLVLNQAHDAVFFVEPTGVIRWCNRQVVAITGRTKEHLIGQPLVTLLSPESAPTMEERLAAVEAGERARPPLEVQIARPDGAPAWLEVNATVITASRGLSGRLLLARDITERKRATEEKQFLETQLRQAHKLEAVGQLAGGVAHDFNNLLTVIIGNSEVLAKHLPRDHPRFKHVDQIRQAATRASALTRQLLAFSRRQVLEPKVLNPNDIVIGLQDMLRRLIGEDIELVTRLAPDVGRIRADRGQIEQVVLNLALNARDAMPQGGRLTIETANVQLDERTAFQYFPVSPGPYVMLSLTDTGCGMDEATQAHIFEPFFTTKDKGKGTGLGLSTVYGIVQQSGGTLWMTTELGRGTTFRVGLPRVEAPLTPTEEGSGALGARRGSGTVLLVEDDEMIRTLASHALHECGYATLEAANGEEAVRLCREHRGSLHLVITDVVLPGINGYELAQRLKGLQADIKVVYISGYPGHVRDRYGPVDSAAPLLQKPFSLDRLVQTVHEVLAKPV